jgi:hypothetical protein
LAGQYFLKGFSDKEGLTVARIKNYGERGKMEAVKTCSKFGAEVAEEHAIEAGAEDVTSVEGDDQV